MKELNEYTAEVLRRAEGIKAARKRRRDALMLCVPVALTLAAALILPRYLRKGPDGISEVMATHPAAVETSPEVDSPEIEGVDGLELRCTVCLSPQTESRESYELSPEDAAEMAELLASVKTCSAVDDCIDESAGTGYSISLNEGGKVSNYTFADGILTEDSTGSRYMPTAEQ